MINSKEIFTVSGPTTSGRPYLNENQIGAITTSSTFLADKRTLMNWIKRTAEAIGIIRQISMDVITRISFVALPQEQKKGRPAKLDPGQDAEAKATKFAKDNHLKQQLRAAMIEGPALGDAYLWMGKVSLDEKKEILKKVYKQVGIELKESELEAKAIDEDYVGEKTIQYVASATMNIEVDSSGTKIKSYVQRTALGFGTQTFPSATIRSTTEGTMLGKTRRWNPDQIIHYKFMELDGKVHGFTPMQSVFPIMKTLGAIKDYHGHYFESAIMPDIIFNFEEDDPNSVHHEKMQQLLEEWWNNKRRSAAITTGKFKVHEFNKWNKDMEFRMLAIYYTGVMAFSIGMPLEKIRAILGGEMKSTTGGSDISNTDYQRNIYDMQDDWEQLLNTQFFNENFGVDIKFERSAARDEVAEVLRDSQKTSWIDKMFKLDWIKEDDRIDFLAKEFPAIPKEYWNPNPEPELPMLAGAGMPFGQKPPPGQASQSLSDQKKREQEPQARNRPPTGIKELFSIDLDRFKEEVQQAGITEESRNNIELEERGNNVILYLTPIGIDKTYMTIIPKSKVSDIDKFIFGPISKEGKIGSKELFEIDLPRFKDEITKAGITSESRNKIEVEDRGTSLAYYLTLLGINKTYMTVVSKSKLSNVDKFVLGPISKPGKRVK